MKSIILALILFSLLFGIALWSALAVSGRCDDLEAVCKVFPTTDAPKEEKNKAVESLRGVWEKARPLFCLTSMRDNVRDMDEAFCRLESAVETDSDTEYSISLSHMRHLLSDLRKRATFNISYIL